MWYSFSTTTLGAKEVTVSSPGFFWKLENSNSVFLFYYDYHTVKWETNFMHSQWMFLEKLTFDPDITVPLKVVVSSFPRVPIVTEQSNGRSRTHRDIPHTFFVYSEEKKRKTLNNILNIVRNPQGVTSRSDPQVTSEYGSSLRDGPWLRWESFMWQ